MLKARLVAAHLIVARTDATQLPADPGRSHGVAPAACTNRLRHAVTLYAASYGRCAGLRGDPEARSTQCGVSVDDIDPELDREAGARAAAIAIASAAGVRLGRRAPIGPTGWHDGPRRQRLLHDRTIGCPPIGGRARIR